jgi:hypothetical protein
MSANGLSSGKPIAAKAKALNTGGRGQEGREAAAAAHTDGPFCLFRSHCLDADITGSYANRLFDGDNKYLSIAYMAGLRTFLDRQNRFVQFVVL